MSSPPADPKSDFAVARNTAWNLLGTAIPVVVAVCCIPLLIRGLGAPRFGVLTIGGMLVVCASQVNFGLGRATVKMVAEARDRLAQQRLPVVLGSSLVAHVILGLIGGTALALLVPWLATSVLSIPLELQVEATNAFYLLALTVPIVVVSDCLRSVLEGEGRFDLINAVQTPGLVLNYAGPIVVLQWSCNLFPIVGLIAVGRCAVLVSYAVFNWRLSRAHRAGMRAEWSIVRDMFGFGGWTVVSALIAPLMAALDRLMIGTVVSVSAVAWYATPYEIVTKMWLFSNSLLAVLFPVFSALRLSQPNRLRALYGRAVAVLTAQVLPVVALLLMCSRELLEAFAGAEFARQGAPAMQWLAIGVGIHVVAQVPFTMLQSLGEARVPAVVQLIQFPLYALAVWVLASQLGIAGVAIAWTLRAGLEALVLFRAVERRLVPVVGTPRERFQYLKLVPAALGLVVCWHFDLLFAGDSTAKLSCGMCGLALFVIWEWLYLIGDADRDAVLRRLRFVTARLKGA